MKQKISNLLILVSIFSINIMTVQAAIPSVYTNETFLAVEHDAPVSFTRDAEGNFSGVTKTGKLFSQRIVTNSYSVRLQRFLIDEAFFYISDKGIILADSDTVALSIYLTRLV